MAQILPVGLGELNLPKTKGKPNVLSHEVRFEVVTGADITPAWRLSRVNINQRGTLLSASRNRTHDLMITFGPADPPIAGLVRQAQDIHLARQIGLSVSNNARIIAPP
jgi:hypothetical protein